MISCSRDTETVQMYGFCIEPGFLPIQTISVSLEGMIET